MKSFADDTVCEECDNYDRCDHTMVADNARTAIEALEKQLPKKPIEYEDKYYACPICGNVLMHKYEKYPTILADRKNGLPCCLSCLQVIDWSESQTRFRQERNGYKNKIRDKRNGIKYKKGHAVAFDFDGVIHKYSNWLLLKMEKYVWECIIIAKKNGGLENKREKDGIQISIMLLHGNLFQNHTRRKRNAEKGQNKRSTAPEAGREHPATRN